MQTRLVDASPVGEPTGMIVAMEPGKNFSTHIPQSSSRKRTKGFGSFSK